MEAIREQFNEETFGPDAYFSQETDETSAGFASVDPHSEGNFQCLFHETLRLKTMRQFPRNRLKLLLKMLELSWNATPGWVLLGRFQGPAISWFWVLLPLSSPLQYSCAISAPLSLSFAPLLKFFFLAPLLQIWSISSVLKICTSNLLLSYLKICLSDSALLLWYTSAPQLKISFSAIDLLLC